MYKRLTTIGALLVLALSYWLTSGEPEQPRAPYIQGKNKTVLFLANEEYGLSNVHIATAFSLLENYPDIDVHYASFAKAQKRIDRVSAFARAKQPAAKDITFHALDGTNFKSSVEETGGEWLKRVIQPPGIRGINATLSELQWLFAPWSVESHMLLYHQMGALIDEIDPAVVVLETFFRPAIDVTRDKHRMHAIITPNTLIDNFQAVQPFGKMFWKYPAFSSGFAYPVPLWDIPANIYLNLRMIYSLVNTPLLADKKAAFTEIGLSEPVSLLKMHRADAPWITMNTEGASIPVDYIPPNVTCAGPIVLSSAPAAEQDAEMAKWLKNAPTVMVNLGSLMKYSELRATIMAEALADLLSKTNVQVIWKVAKYEDYNDDYLASLKPYIQSDRIRVSKWLGVDPVALLETGDIIASVHHGGSSCYHEAVAAGVAHVILPMWMDLYGFASLVGSMGVGIWGCKETSPDWNVQCLSEAFQKVVRDDPAGIALRARARQVGDRIAAGPKGRDISAGVIADFAYVKDKRLIS